MVVVLDSGTPLVTLCRRERLGQSPSDLITAFALQGRLSLSINDPAWCFFRALYCHSVACFLFVIRIRIVPSRLDLANASLSRFHSSRRFDTENTGLGIPASKVFVLVGRERTGFRVSLHHVSPKPICYALSALVLLSRIAALSRSPSALPGKLRFRIR
jgi:hypothetical protein